MRNSLIFILLVAFSSCQRNALKPVVITELAEHDTDDPAIWIHPTDLSESLIVGTDKETGGGIYAYNLEGKIVKKVTGLKRPNNIDVAYGMSYSGKKVDVAIFTEREANAVRVFRLPDMTPIDDGGIPVFEGESERDPMGVALYTKGEELQMIVGRKTGPLDGYLWQYALGTDSSGKISARLLRKFGNYSGIKEIEAIAVDQELGYVYYSDETVGIRKYYADPEKGNDELAFFARKDVKRDHEGLAIYKTGPGSGYLVVSNQQNNSLVLYSREGTGGHPHTHVKIADIPVSAKETDGLEVSPLGFNAQFPEGILVMMSNGKVFHFYDWRDVKERLLAE